MSMARTTPEYMTGLNGIFAQRNSREMAWLPPYSMQG
jgi:hypothetical protein